MKKKQLMAACGILAAALCMGGCSKVDGTQTVLTVNDDTVSMGAAMFDLRYQQAEMFSYYEQMYKMYGMEMDGYWSTEIGADVGVTTGTEETEPTESMTYGEQFKEQVMTSLTDMVLLSQHAAEYDVAVSEEDEAAIKEAAQKFMDANDAEILEKNGITADSVAEYMRLFTVYARMQEPMVADVDTNVTDEEAKESVITYVRIKEATPAEGEEAEAGEETKTFASLEEEAEAVLARLKQEKDIATADMEAIAKEVGPDTFTVQISYDALDLTYDAKVKEAANTLTDGQLYDGVIEGEDGNYYLVRMDSVMDIEKTEANKITIAENRKTDAYDALVKEWKDAASITVNDAMWKKVSVKDSEQYRTKVEEAEAEDTEAASTAEEAETVSSVAEETAAE